MKIKGAFINGFGLYHNVHIKDISPGLTLFFGKNESGKSSLLAFIRAVLFGFPDGRKKENPYHPLSGGKHGGNLSVITSGNEEYIIERYPGPAGGRVEVLDCHGKKGGKEKLAGLLSISDPSLFNNIYAFGLSELQDFETLESDAVSEALYSAGAGLDPASLRELKNTLDKREDNLFKPKGKAAQINRILNRAGEINREKRGLRFNMDEYDRLMAHISRLSREIKDLEEKKIGLALKTGKLEKQAAVFPEWIELTHLKERLSKTGKTETFPEDGLIRFDTLKNRALELVNEIEEKKDSIKKTESGISALKGHGLAEKADSIKFISKNTGAFNSLLKGILSVNREISEEEGRLTERAKALGPDWDETRIRNFDLSIAAGEQVRKFIKEIRERELEIRDLKGLLEQILLRQGEVESELKDIRKPAIADPYTLKGQKKSLRELKRLYRERLMLEKDLTYINERLNSLREEIKTIEQQDDTPVFKIPVWLSPLCMAACLVSAWLLYTDKNILNTAGTSLFFTAGIAAWFTERILKKAENKKRKERQKILSDLREKTHEQEKTAEEAGFRLQNILDDMGIEQQKLFLEIEITEDLLEARAEELHETEYILNKIKDTEKRISAIKTGYSGTRKRYEKAVLKKDDLILKWQEWLKAGELNPNLSPDGAAETLDIIKSCAETAGILERLRQKRSSLEKEKAGLCSRFNRLLSDCGRSPVPDDELLYEINRLLEDFERDRETEKEKDLFTEKLGMLNSDLNRIAAHTQEVEGEITALFEIASAENEEDYRRRGKEYYERHGLLKEIEARRLNILRLSGSRETADEILNQIPGLDFNELEGEKIRTEEAFKDTEILLDSHKRNQARLEERVNTLVNDDRLSILRAEEEDLKEKLQTLTEEWITVRFAKGLLNRAMSKFEKERQPCVISGAGGFLNKMTMGRYPSIASPIGENRIEIVDRHNSRKSIDKLSRGTAEQLYLALRFGFIEEFSSRAEPMPVIMDEILVNFDKERAEAAIKGILELSRTMQVLYFTCHPHVVDMFLKADKDITVMEISGGEICRMGKVKEAP